MTQRIKIAFRANGEGSLECVDLGTFPCLGNHTIKYPKDITISLADKKGTHHSQEFNVDMPHSILIWGQRGIFIHGWPGSPTLLGNGGPSAGCIHLALSDAVRAYNWIKGRTRITIAYPW